MSVQSLRRRFPALFSVGKPKQEESIMPNREEQMKILQMVADGSITPEEAAHLLEALEAGEETHSSDGQASVAGQKGRWLKIRVTDTITGRARVNVRVPLAIVRGALKLGGRVNVVSQHVDQEILQALEKALVNGTTGKFIDVVDEEGRERVEIFIE